MGSDTLLQMSEPFLVDTTRTIVSVGGDCPAVAYGDSVYLGVYAEWRGDVNGIYAMRIDNQGRLLDSINLQISLGGYYPDVAYAKQSGIFLVVWHEAGSIRGKRITTDGQILDNDDIIISGSSPQASYPSVASDGKDFFVVWEDQRNGTNDIYGARVSSSGQVVDPEGIKIDERVYVYSHCIAFADSFYFVAYYSNTQDAVVAKRILSSTGEIIDNSPLWISDIVNPYKIIFDGRRFFIMGLSERYPKALRVNKDGIVIDSVPIDISSSIRANGASATFDGKDYGILWGNNFIEVDTTGKVLDSTYQQIAGVGGYPNIAFNGNNYFLLWSNLDGIRISKQGQVLDAVPVHYSYAGNEQESPAVAFNGWEYLIAYATDKGEGIGKDIYAVRISQYGERIGEPMHLYSGQTPDWIKVGSAGSSFLVVWNDGDGTNTKVYGRIVNGDGTLGDSVFMINGEPPPLSVFISDHPAVASDGERYFVIWYDWWRIKGRFISKEGKFESDVIVVTGDTRWDGNCDMVYDGEGYFIVYDWYSSGDYGGTENVNCVKLSKEGEYKWDNTIAINMDYDEYNPSVAYDGKNIFVMWVDYRDFDNTGTDIYGVWLDKRCRKVSGEIEVSKRAGLEYTLKAIRLGNKVLSVWRAGNKLYGEIIDEAGGISERIDIDTVPGGKTGKFCEGPSGTIFLASTGFAGYPFCNERIYGKYIRYKEEGILPISELIIYPTVNNGRFTLKFTGWESGNIDLCLYDIVGRKVKEWNNVGINSGMNEISMEINNILSGKYFLYLSSEREKLSTPMCVVK